MTHDYTLLTPTSALLSRLTSAVRFIFVTTFLATAPFSASAQSFAGFDDNVVFPDDAGVIDLTQPPYLVRGDGATDNTEAIQRAFEDNPSGNKIFYLPEGEYLVSNTIAWKGLDGAQEKRNILQGQNTHSTIIRLVDNAAGYQDPDNRRAVINTGFKPAQRFRNAIRNLTVSTGSGNPGAAGIQFIANNQGGIYSVIIRSEDGTGTLGLDMQYTDEIGPLLVKELVVEGFDIGIKTEFQTASQTFEDIYLSDQNTYGWHNTGTQTVFARNVTSDNSVPAILNNREGRFLLIDATLTNTAGTGGDAIINQKSFYARNVATPGYETAITNNLLNFRGNSALRGPYIEEYWANGAYQNRYGGPFELFPSPDQSLNLPVAETPFLPWENDLSEWVSPVEFGGRPDDGLDDTEALQQAIDAGKTTVYLPNNVWRIDGELIVRGNVERLIGTEARLEGAGSIRVKDGAAANVRIERLEVGDNLRLIHNTSRSITFSAILSLLRGLNYESTEIAGDLFLEDVNMEAFTLQPQQRLWARQLNIETDTEDDDRAKLTNNGGTAWILGYKTEMGGTTIKTTDGGATELLGALHVSGTGDAPRFITEDAAFSAATVHTAPAGTEFPVQAVERRAGVTRSATSFDLSNTYTAFPAETIADSIRYVDNADSAGIVLCGEWLAASGFPGGFLESDFLYADPGNDNLISFVSPLPAPGRYEVFLRWVNDRSGQPHSGHATNTPATVNYRGGDSLLRIDQKINGGQWNSLGTYPFADTGTVTLDAELANGKVIADGVRFVRVDADLPQTIVLIHAAGRTNEERMELQVDGKTVKAWDDVAGNALARDFVTYTYRSDQPIRASQLRILFPNDDGGDRDLRIDRITVNDTLYETEAPTTYSTGTWQQADACAAGFKEREWLNCTGYFAYQQIATKANAPREDEPEVYTSVRVYPNPASEQVTIEGPLHYRIDIYNLQGQLVSQADNLAGKSILTVAGLNSGIYTVHLTDHATQQTYDRQLVVK